MQRIRQLVPVFFLAAVLMPAVVRAEPLAPLADWMRSLVEQNRVLGCAAQVTQGGRTIFLEAYGHRTPMAEDELRTDQVVRIYSMTKAITSAAIMQLVEQGQLGIDDPVSRYIPEFTEVRVGLEEASRSPSRGITIRDLLTHTSGLAYDFSCPPEYKHAYETVFRQSGTLEKAGAGMAQLPLLHDPGEQFTYGVNTDVLGRVVEVVAEQPFQEYLEAEIFEPLGMVDTAFEPPADLHRMHIVTRVDGELQIDQAHYAAEADRALKPRFPSGGGGLWSTLSDYTRFMQAMERGGELDGVRILKPATVAFMTQNHLSPSIDGPQRFGLGFGLEPPVQTSRGMRGGGRWTWGGAASTYFLIDPRQDLTAVFITQKFPFDFSMAEEFPKAVLEAVAVAQPTSASEGTGPDR